MNRLKCLLNTENRLFKLSSDNKKNIFLLPVLPLMFLAFLFVLTVNISYFLINSINHFKVILIIFDLLFIPSAAILFIKFVLSMKPSNAADKPHQNESRFKSLIESMNYLIVRVNLNGQFIFVNEAFCKKFGKSSDELLGTAFMPLVDPENLQATMEKLKKIKEPPYRIDFEQCVNTVEGLRWIEWENNAIADSSGNIFEIQSIGRDITERKNYEEKLHLQELAIQKTANGVVITDATSHDNPVIFCNPAYEKMTGYKSDEVIGKNPRFLQGPDTDRSTIEKIRNTLKKQEECNVIILNYKKDGTAFWNEIRIIPIHDKKGKLVNFLGIKRDISDRIDDEKTIKASETKFRSIVEQSIDGVMLIDEAGMVVEWNHALEKITGFSKKETMGKSLFELKLNKEVEGEVSKESSYKFQNIIREIIEKKGTKYFNRTFEDELITKKGEIKSLQSIVYPIITDKGVMIGSVIRDITQTKRIEKQNVILNRAIESSASGVVLFDLNFYVQYVNKSIIQMMGAENDSELKGRSVFDFISENDIEVVRNEYIPELLKNSEWFGEIELKRLNGQPVSGEVNCSFVINDQNIPVYMLAIINDITERKKSEEALKESERRYRLVVDHIKEVIFQTDAAGNWEFLNPAWEEVMGYTVKESIGQLFLNYVHPEDRERNNKEFEKLVCRSKEHCRHIIRYVTKNGSFKWIEVFARLILNEKGEITGTSGSLYDITEKFLAEEEIKEALQKEKELGELKSRFVSTVSHEFRTPLTSILASAELVLRYNEKWNDEKKLNTIKRIQNSALFMNGMVSEVLDLNRAESGRLAYTPEKLELVSFLNEIFEEIKPLSKEKHDLKYIAEEDNITGSFDEKMLKSVVINLLSNAIKYSPDGGRVELKLRKKDNTVNISVSDNGMGIPEEDQINLFLPFFRAKNIGNISGTGLGLSIVRKNIELQKGEITFSSESGKGTTFFVTLPLNN